MQIPGRPRSALPWYHPQSSPLVCPDGYNGITEPKHNESHLPPGFLRRAKLILTRNGPQDPPAKGPVTVRRAVKLRAKLPFQDEW
jgi:hypothetical protein